jgi:hypothetical protein
MSSSAGRPTVEVIEHDLSMITDKLHRSMSNGVDFYGVPDLKQCEGLLKHTGVRKSDDDFAGWEVRNGSFISNCNITIMIGGPEQAAVPARKGSDAWNDVRETYLAEKEKIIGDLHWKASGLLGNMLELIQGTSGLESMDVNAIYDFSQCLSKVLSSLNRVVSPLTSGRSKRPAMPVICLPPVSDERDDSERIIELQMNWAVHAMDAIIQCREMCSNQATKLQEILEEQKACLDAAKEGRDLDLEEDECEEDNSEEEVCDSTSYGSKRKAAVVFLEGNTAEASVPQRKELHTKLVGYQTFFVRRADYKAVLDLLDRIGEVQDSFINKGEHKPRSLASNALTAVRKVQNKTAKLGVHRTSVMPNTYLLVTKMNLFRGGLDSAEMVMEVVKRLRPLLFQPKHSVIQSGTLGMGMYFVNTGTVRVKVNSREVRCLDNGNFFGEIALTMTSQRTADVYCDSQCELFELSRSDFKQVVKKFPILWKRLRKQARLRIKSGGAQRTTKATVVMMEDGDDNIEQDNQAGSSMDKEGFSPTESDDEMALSP